MASGQYDPRGYLRICDICGNRRFSTEMRVMPPNLRVCNFHPQERTHVQLDRGNAAQPPFLILPVRNAKPEDPFGPSTYETEEGLTLNFVAGMVAEGAQYFSVMAGSGAAIAGNALPALGWSARYLYNLIVEDRRPARFLSLARLALETAANNLMARQTGFGLSPSSTRANDAFYGSFLASGATTRLTEDAATGGLALLYAYRVLGITRYLVGARAAASYLRNVQAIGSDGTNYTSADAGGTERLYTGAVTSYVVNMAGFYSDHEFYPAGLLAMDLWTELRETDGDQSLGATAAVTGFASIPSAQLSTCVTDMRTFWSTGTRDAYSGNIITGLSATTPREVFNAFPATKPNTTVTGTGSWEYADGGAAIGTEVSSQNFAKAVAVLYDYEGASTQVTAVDDWLRSFESNPSFETPDDTSPQVLARTTTGDYDVVNRTLATLLTVRDASASYAATAVNGSSLYDWGAFGLLSPLWATRHSATFVVGRRAPMGWTQRFDNGTASDSDYFDAVALRGRSGLTMQTGFTETIFGVTNMVDDCVAAAQLGQCYRERPDPMPPQPSEPSVG